ncbi:MULTISPECIES: NAD(P)H-dependent glycerol-3-phosphate dehydrogenase [Halobacteriovorax]|uniref:Glycerol-3-phosphate dehydrogenase [NAD(P)+] n=1 Tax=Halobacteriovorax vibrionivorans TaxID=2152716 RepID=A0ABY0IID4_9BACT|nr:MULTISPECIES: NAD(P)H-dependent glycerol-3-phosphate dehydrogenase [Halobacteriovorax]AYF45138.1 NAD-dependent glycerol-3-phosphate dehydrogenase C-terminal [Halobacteriovorax sp. BALOs_7]RZF22234.1 NAD(P)-dependent glycerol-3-phosphate dehydrogenase [Halobacteriovorax vibrionivorans]TGD48486.1 NAD(P)-dependent glycerol-3-phosphate dehydrogenase [Halobacteriovorax sp. Y22]
MTKIYKTALVVGAGAFGTSIASILANKFEHVILKVRSEDVYQNINDDRENSVYLPGIKLDGNIKAIIEWDEFDTNFEDDLELVVSGLPTHGIRTFFSENLDRFEGYLKREIPIISLSKGIDPETLELSDDLFNDFFPQYRDYITFLSGPSFAKEIMEKQITLVTIAGRSKKVLMDIATKLDTPYFKALPSYDIKGVLLGGALKNVLAIAGGIVEGLGYNHNTRAAMITRGIVEMLRFGKVFNARPETFYGLSGMGDLILTTTGGLSRNKTFGLEIAKGRKPLDIINSQRTVVEGYKTTKAAFLLAEKYDIRARIFKGLYEVLYNDANVEEVLEKLMKAPIKFEID